jgi:two-component system, chemotaxis family, chemotaxis protein CheY
MLLSDATRPARWVKTMADILIIDDDPQIRRLLNRILRDAGHAVREAENGRDGVTLFQQHQPDLVITDIVMPDMEGLETILTLRQDGPTVPIIAISGGSDPLYLKAAGKLGATAELTKPFSATEIVDLVDALLANPRTE